MRGDVIGRRVALALLAALLAVLVSTVPLVWAMQRQLNDAERQSRDTLRRQLMLKSDELKRLAAGYAMAGSTAAAVSGRLDLDRLDSDVALPAAERFGIDMTFVIAPNNDTLYAVTDHRRLRTDARDHLTRGFVEALRYWRQTPSGDARSGFVLADGAPAMMALAPIRPVDRIIDADIQGEPLLVLVRKIDGPTLLSLGSAIGSDSLHLESASEQRSRDPDAIALSSLTGEQIAVLALDSGRGQRSVLAWLFLPIGLTVIGAILFWLLFRRYTTNLEQQLAHSRMHSEQDPLTGLPNRVRLFRDLEHHLANPRRRVDRLAVLLLDLDGFKTVNDVHGHQSGDHILREVADRLRQTVRETDMIARLGGDEFVILQTRAIEDSDVAEFARRLTKAIELPFYLGEQSIKISVSIGIAVSPGDGTEPNDLIRKADSALYEAKANGKNGWHFYRQSARDRGTTAKAAGAAAS